MSVWVREYSDGDWEVGLYDPNWQYGPIMDASNGFCYYFNLDLSKWIYIGEFE